MARIAAGTPSRADRAAPAVPYRAALVAVVAAATVAGFALAGGDAAAGAPQAADTELTRLLRMMALLKLSIVAGAAWLVDWRLRQPPVGAPVAAAYLAGLGLMAVGPGLIWSLTHLVLGAVLLHAGIALLLILACKDEDLRFRLRRR